MSDFSKIESRDQTPWCQESIYQKQDIIDISNISNVVDCYQFAKFTFIAYKNQEINNDNTILNLYKEGVYLKQIKLSEQQLIQIQYYPEIDLLVTLENRQNLVNYLFFYPQIQQSSVYQQASPIVELSLLQYFINNTPLLMQNQIVTYFTFPKQLNGQQLLIDFRDNKIIIINDFLTVLTIQNQTQQLTIDYVLQKHTKEMILGVKVLFLESIYFILLHLSNCIIFCRIDHFDQSKQQVFDLFYVLNDNCESQNQLATINLIPDQQMDDVQLVNQLFINDEIGFLRCFFIVKLDHKYKNETFYLFANNSNNIEVLILQNNILKHILLQNDFQAIQQEKNLILNVNQPQSMLVNNNQLHILDSKNGFYLTSFLLDFLNINTQTDISNLKQKLIQNEIIYNNKYEFIRSICTDNNEQQYLIHSLKRLQAIQVFNLSISPNEEDIKILKVKQNNNNSQQLLLFVQFDNEVSLKQLTLSNNIIFNVVQNYQRYLDEFDINLSVKQVVTQLYQMIIILKLLINSNNDQLQQIEQNINLIYTLILEQCKKHWFLQDEQEKYDISKIVGILLPFHYESIYQYTGNNNDEQLFVQIFAKQNSQLNTLVVNYIISSILYQQEFALYNKYVQKLLYQIQQQSDNQYIQKIAYQFIDSFSQLFYNFELFDFLKYKDQLQLDVIYQFEKYNDQSEHLSLMFYVLQTFKSQKHIQENEFNISENFIKNYIFGPFLKQNKSDFIKLIIHSLIQNQMYCEVAIKTIEQFDGLKKEFLKQTIQSLTITNNE